jgi:HlyD family secretion protein
MIKPTLIKVPEPRPVSAMDRKVERRPLAHWKLIAIAAAGIALAILVFTLLRQSRINTYAIDADRVTISAVRTGTFLDFVPVRASVTPLTTVYLDAIEGGRVEKLFLEEGSFVEKDQPILELSNSALQLDVIAREAEVTEQMNNLRNTQLAMEQNRLSLKSTLVEVDYQIVRLEKLARDRKALVERGLIARKDYEDTVDELEYYRNRGGVTLESQQQDEQMRRSQIDSLKTGVAQLQKNLVIARKNLEYLTLRAPISGKLTALKAELGESKQRGERLGQIDNLDRFKLTAHVDEFYLPRMSPGQPAAFTLDRQEYALKVTKVFSEVRDGQFEVELAFTGAPPANLRRGQTFEVRVGLGDSSQALLLSRGAFAQETGGHWAFVLDASGDFAERQPVRLGRRNPEYFEVLEGLRAGDRVITSSYGAFANRDRIEFKH